MCRKGDIMGLLLGLLAYGALVGGVLGIFFKFFTPDDFSIWNNEWFGRDKEKDQSYLNRM